MLVSALLFTSYVILVVFSVLENPVSASPRGRNDMAKMKVTDEFCDTLTNWQILGDLCVLIDFFFKIYLFVLYIWVLYLHAQLYARSKHQIPL